MAVVFASPKQRVKIFFLGTLLIFLLFLVAIYAVVFFSKFATTSLPVVDIKPKINIDMSIFNSEKFKKLQAFAKFDAEIQTGRDNPFTPYYQTPVVAQPLIKTPSK